MKAILVSRVNDLFAWACAEHDMIGLNLLYASGQVNIIQGG